MKRSVKKIWICLDVWMDILPFFDRPELGLDLALRSSHFDDLVDKYFGGKKELTLWKEILIGKDEGMPPKFFVDGKFEGFPVPDRPLPNNIRFRHLKIDHIDHSVIEFLRSNKQIWDRSGTDLELCIWSNKTEDDQPNWDVFAHEIWPVFVTNIRQLGFSDGAALDNLRRLVSPTFLTDLNINAINSYILCPGVIAADGDDVPTATLSAGQALSKWLHTPRKDGQPKRLRCWANSYQLDLEWITNFKETFPRATTSVSYKIRFYAHRTTQIVPFELMNEQTKEKLTLSKESKANWLLKRCPISGETAALQKQREKDENLADDFYYSGANLNILCFNMHRFQNYIGPLSPPTDKSDKNVCSSAAGPSSDQRNE